MGCIKIEFVIVLLTYLHTYNKVFTPLVISNTQFISKRKIGDKFFPEPLVVNVVDKLQESILENVTLYRTDNSASEIPLLKLKTNSSTFEAICFRMSAAQQLMFLSLAICRTLGYVALQRYSMFPSAYIKRKMFYTSTYLLDCVLGLLHSSNIKEQNGSTVVYDTQI